MRTKPDQFHFLPEFSDAIANAANCWAALEYSVNKTIWALAEVPPAPGACLTAQIFTLNARLNALISLMQLRHLPTTLIKAANKFASNVGEAQEARNRIIHDYWMNDRTKTDKMGIMGKLTITAQKTARFKVESVHIDELRDDLEKLQEKRFEFEKIATLIVDILPTLPEMPHVALYPVHESRHPR